MPEVLTELVTASRAATVQRIPLSQASSISGYLSQTCMPLISTFPWNEAPRRYFYP